MLFMVGILLLFLVGRGRCRLRETLGEQQQQAQTLHSTRPSSPLRDTKTKIAMVDEKLKKHREEEEAIEQERLRQIQAEKELRAQSEIDKKRQINRQSALPTTKGEDEIEVKDPGI